MPVVYEQAHDDVHDLAREIFEDHHPELLLPDKTYPKLCIMMATRSGDDPEPPLKLNNYPCAAIISVIPYKQRVDKRADAEILIDSAAWDGMTLPQQTALLDHEITHLELTKDGDGFLKTDDQGRPKLNLRNHDWQLGGFRSIAQRYGNDALEVCEARGFRKCFGDVAYGQDAPEPLRKPD